MTGDEGVRYELARLQEDKAALSRRVRELERQLAKARALLRQTAIEVDELGFPGPARSIRAALEGGAPAEAKA